MLWNLQFMQFDNYISWPPLQKMERDEIVQRFHKRFSVQKTNTSNLTLTQFLLGDMIHASLRVKYQRWELIISDLSWDTRVMNKKRRVRKGKKKQLFFSLIVLWFLDDSQVWSWHIYTNETFIKPFSIGRAKDAFQQLYNRNDSERPQPWIAVHSLKDSPYEL